LRSGTRISPENGILASEIGAEKEVVVTIKQFSQTDPQWKTILLGFDKTSTIGGYGCLLTSFAMVASHYGAADLTPAKLNDKMKTVGGFEAGTAYIIGGMLGSVVPGFTVEYRPARGIPAPLKDIDAALVDNRPVIVEVDWSPNAGLQTHYMVAYAKNGTDYLVYDPYPYPVTNGQIKLSQSKYASVAGTKDPARIITGLFFTRGGAISPPPPRPKLGTGSFASFPVYSTVGELAVRWKPVIDDTTLLERVAAGTEFKVLETDAAGTAKIGQLNQWLAVEAPDGTQGYTAAWLVSKTKAGAAASTTPTTAPTAGSTTTTPAPATASVVKTTADLLKLRSRPDFTDATVLKMYPIGTELKVLEPAADVKRKVGTVYQWLKVVDAQGVQGVVAAWYVQIVSLGS
jgi:peptidase C39-like protein